MHRYHLQRYRVYRKSLQNVPEDDLLVERAHSQLPQLWNFYHAGYALHVLLRERKVLLRLEVPRVDNVLQVSGQPCRAELDIEDKNGEAVEVGRKALLELEVVVLVPKRE